MSMWRKRILAMAAIPAALLFMPSGAEASHQWSNYHWERDGIAVRDVTVANKHDPSSIWGKSC